jgi:hypothetical protein
VSKERDEYGEVDIDAAVKAAKNLVECGFWRSRADPIVVARALIALAK